MLNEKSLPELNETELEAVSGGKKQSDAPKYSRGDRVVVKYTVAGRYTKKTCRDAAEIVAPDGPCGGIYTNEYTYTVRYTEGDKAGTTESGIYERQISRA